MDDEIERLVVSVRADTQGFSRDVSAMRAELDGPFAGGLERAGRVLENSLSGALRRGKFGFEDLRRVALSVLAEIASAAVRSGLQSLGSGASSGGGGGSGGGIGGFLAQLAPTLLSIFGGAPGMATGGPVTPGRAYRVGENGPELFVPTSSGRIEANGSRSGASPINVTIRVSDNGRGSAPNAIRRSSRHVARALRDALDRSGE
jgi:phage-related minor tail protein